MDVIPITAWANIGPWGLVTVFVLLVGLGGLIPRWTYNRTIKDKDIVIANLNKALDKRDDQFTKLSEQNRVIISLLEDIKIIGQSRKEASPL